MCSCVDTEVVMKMRIERMIRPTTCEQNSRVPMELYRNNTVRVVDAGPLGQLQSRGAYTASTGVIFIHTHGGGWHAGPVPFQ